MQYTPGKPKQLCTIYCICGTSHTVDVACGSHGQLVSASAESTGVMPCVWRCQASQWCLVPRACVGQVLGAADRAASQRRDRHNYGPYLLLLAPSDLAHITMQSE